MLSSVGQNNNVQRFSAVNALRNEASRLNKPAENNQNSVVENTSDGTAIDVRNANIIIDRIA